MVKYFIKIINIKDEKEVFLQPDGNNQYNTFRKNSIINNVKENVFKQLALNGLYSTYETGMNENNSLCSIHRFAMSLRYKIINKILHHINKNKENNSLNNLLPLNSYDEHKTLDSLPPDIGIQKSKEMHNNYNFDLDISRNTIGNNRDLVIKILSNPNLKAHEIEKLIGKKLKHSKISAIRQYYFYAQEFLSWLSIHSTSHYNELCGNLNSSWHDLLTFEQNLISRNPKYQAYFN